jgi:hypothetical protein
VSQTYDHTPAKQLGVAGLMLALLVPFAVRIGDIYVDPSDPGFGSRDFPKLIVITGLVLSFGLAAKAAHDMFGIKSALVDWGKFWVELLAVGSILLAAVFYIWGIILFQYAVPTLLLLIFMMRYFGSRGMVQLVVLPILAVIVYYTVFFVLFGIYEEPGVILQYDSYSFARAIRKLINMN